MATLEINSWFTSVFGIDPAKYLTPATPEANRSEEANQSIERDEGWATQSIDLAPPEADADAPPKPAKKGQTSQVGGVATFSGSAEIKGPAVAVLGGCFEAIFSIGVEATGSIATIVPDQGKTTTIGMTYSDGAIAAAVATKWHDDHGTEFFGFRTAFTEVTMSGGVKIDKGIKVSFTGTGKLACGTALEFTAVVLSIDNDAKLEAMTVSVGANFPSVALKAIDVPLGPLVKVTDVSIQPTVKLVIEPNWPMIMLQITKEAGKDVAVEVAAAKGGQAAVSSAGVDLAIAAGFLAIAAASVAASIATIQGLKDVSNTQVLARKLTNRMLAGYRIGVLGGTAPGGDTMTLGYQLGVAKHEKSVLALRAKFPEITDEQVQTVLTTVVDRVVAEARSTIEEKACEMVWDNFASTHEDTWSHSNEVNRWNAWSAIFGHAANGDPRYAKYRNEHTRGTLGM